MRKSLITIAAIGTAAAFALTACGSDSSSGSGSGSSGGSSGGSASGQAKGSCNLSTPPASTAKAPASSGTALKASGKVGVILPDTTSSIRYSEFDTPLLTAAFKKAGIKADIQNAGGDKTKFASIAQSMIGEGVSVLVIDSIDAPSGAQVEAQAKKAGVKVIDYDRVNLGGSADYYVSFDNEAIGKLQGQSLVNCLSQYKVTADPATVIQLDGGTDVDNNAVLFKKGAESVLKSDSKVKIVADAVVKGWTVSNAAPAFTQALTSVGGSVDAVYAANDDIANAAITVLKSKGLAGKVPVTGQDAGVEGLQNILNGTQCATIYKSYAEEAAAASKLAVALVKGQDVASAGVTLTDFQDPQGNRTLKAYLLPAKIVTKSNVKIVVDAGQVKAADLCKGLTSQCKAAGISS